MIPDFTINNFGGLNTAVKDIKALKAGISPDSLNWMTSKYKDSIELRRGYARLGETEVTGNGKVTGLGVGIRYDAVQVPWFSYGRKVKYYDATLDDVVEVGTDILPVGASGEDVWFAPYQGLGGSFMFFGSQNSSVYKVPTANPANAVDQLTNSYRWGVFHIGQNRSFAGQRNGTVAGNNDKTGLYLSYIDKALLSSFTQVTGEVVGALGSTTYSGTLVQRTGVRTVMYVAIKEAGGETLLDDRNGNLVGTLGSTGTINYATGAYSVTFNHVTTGAVTADYYYEDSTSAGILDFTGSGTGQGKVFRQDDGGGVLQAIFNINTVEYCIHQLKTWQLTTTLDDTSTTNLPYRNIGVPYHRSAYQTPEGIIIADLSRPTDPKFRKIQVLDGTNSTTIEPISISDDLDLSAYAFDYSVAFRWGDYEIFTAQEIVNGVANTHNSVMFVHNVVSDTWDKLDYYASCLAEYNGTLIAGDSVSNNVYTLFSGYDEDGDIIRNYWKSSALDFGTDHLKTVRRMVIGGLIQPDQQIKVSLAVNGGQFAEAFTIDGSGEYVDTGIETTIGSATVGSKTVGGGGSDTASPYEVDFNINLERFVDVQVKVEALAVGYASVHFITFKDIRSKGRKNLPIRTM